MNGSLRTLSVALPLGALCLLPAEAHARRRGIGIINTGDNVSHVGDVSEEAADFVRSETGKDVKVGYLYGRFGLFWVNVWTWDGRYCLYDEEDNVWPLEDEQAADIMGVEVDDLSKPWTYRFPPGLPVILVLGGLMVLRRGDD